MSTYRIWFRGRSLGAIGIFYPIVEVVEAENVEEAKLKLYEKYEHLSIESVKEVSK